MKISTTQCSKLVKLAGACYPSVEAYPAST